MKKSLLATLAVVFTFACYLYALAQIGPYNAPGGSTPTAPLVTPSGGSATGTKSTAAPTGTASTTNVMCGCAVVLQPGSNGLVFAAFTFSITNGTATDGASVQLTYGPASTAGANGAALPATWTALGSAKTWTGGTTTSGTNIGTLAFLIALPVSTPTQQWAFDIEFKAVTGGTATLSGVDGVAFEM